MMRRRPLLAAAVLAAPAVHAQAPWPAGRTIRVVIPFPPGAANDAMGRLLAQRLTERLGANAVVENRAGGAGLVGTTAVLQAPPDGTTLLASAFNTVVMPLVLRGATFDPMTDLEVCARTAQAPLALVMAPNRPQRTLAEVVAAAKAAPREWTIAVAALGAPGHLATIEFNRRTGAGLEIAPYRGTAPALTDVMAGNAQLLLDSAFALLPAAADGRVRALGTSSARRSAVAPDVPTLSEAGLPGFEFNAWYGVWAPRGTPPEIRDRVNAVAREMVRDPAIAARLAAQGLEPVDETVEEARAFMAREASRAADLLRSVGYQPE